MAICPVCKERRYGYIQIDGKYYFKECKHLVPIEDKDLQDNKCILK
jgi:hypothetical protein